LAKVLSTLEAIQKEFNASATGGKKVSLADLIVLGGTAAIDAAAKKAGHEVKVPFAPGRTDASQEQTDVESFAPLEPAADGFRNYVRNGLESFAAELLLDKRQPAHPHRAGDDRAHRRPARAGRQLRPHRYGVFTKRPGTLTNDFFVNLLDMNTKLAEVHHRPGVLEGNDRATGAHKWTATVVDLVFGSNSQLRALAEFYAESDAEKAFVQDFVAAWTKVMNLDRFDLK
jgi:catalase-peroxidase